MTSNRNQTLLRPRSLRRVAGIPVVLAVAVLLAGCTSASQAGRSGSAPGDTSTGSRSATAEATDNSAGGGPAGRR
ncbi:MULTISPECIES: hypothetical protein [unclassified Curtobacterium]|uniref:hypothetical protein n=1 Tax=unclassified Curtobacterium TaxID=257496 RepID=UPI000D91E7AF|nr:MULTISPECIES: hypothetical protein [unclassified Curtobacterium]PYY33667.1 hypothetical protein DEI89_09995 [Curtobacterium sp. MCBD17_030]PZE34072.1 hypothetical protein DEJ31_15575 [Curtobacterium sp. MCPF17_031]PZF11944.1 hypothetical protein DEJ25_08850 [Curtobacterium sp. MCPF17_011]